MAGHSAALRVDVTAALRVDPWGACSAECWAVPKAAAKVAPLVRLSVDWWGRNLDAMLAATMVDVRVE